MSAATVETLLARLYTDAALRKDFLANPRAVSLAAGLDQTEAEAMTRIDRAGLQLAAMSFEHKRAAHGARPRAGWLTRLAARLSPRRRRDSPRTY